jgi:hypothetical protein
MEAAGGVLGGAMGAFGNRQKGPSLGQNMADMGSIFGQNSALTANAGYRDLGPAQYYPGQTYAGLGGQTQQSIQNLINTGTNSPTMNAANNYVQGAAGGQYLYSNPMNSQFQSLANQGMNGYNQTAGGYSNIAGAGGMGGYDQVAGTLQNIQGAGGMGGFTSTAPGYSQLATAGSYSNNPSQGGLDYFGSGGEMNQNPYLDQMYKAASRGVVDNFRNSVGPSLMSQFSAAGRTGSGANQGAFGQASQSLGNTLGDMGANMYGSAYESGRNRQLSALSTQGDLYNTGLNNQLNALNSYNSAYNAGIGNQLNATGQTTNAYNQGIQNQLSGLNGLNSSFNQGYSNQMNALGQISNNYNTERGLQQAAAGMAPEMNAATLTGQQAAIQGGQLLDADRQAQIDADKARFDFGQQAPRDYYSNLSGLYNGVQPARIQGEQPQPYNQLAGGLGGSLAGSRVGGLFGDGSLTSIFGFGGGGQQQGQQWGAWNPFSSYGNPSW